MLKYRFFYCDGFNFGEETKSAMADEGGMFWTKSELILSKIQRILKIKSRKKIFADCGIAETPVSLISFFRACGAVFAPPFFFSACGGADFFTNFVQFFRMD